MGSEANQDQSPAGLRTLASPDNFHRAGWLINFRCWMAVFFLSVRPELTLNGGLVIKDGRHPLVHEATREPVVPVRLQCDIRTVQPCSRQL